MKLELKHLAAYLPYGLKLKYDVEYSSEWELDIHNLNALTENDKPILRPLSDLTTAEVDVLRKIMFNNPHQWTKQHWSFIKNVKSFPLFQNYYVVEYLKSIHMDIFGLIEKGLAIPK